jgi:type I restriction enzyme S subunit
MSKENKLIPELRFPEFEKDGEWVENELDHFCFNISSGKDKVSEAGEFPLYGSTGIIGKTDNISYTGDYILVARVGANAGFLNRAKGKFGVTDNTLVLDLKNSDKIDFIYFSLNKIGLNKLVFGSGQPLITAGQLKSLQLVWPKSGKEQQKIASCLSSLDEIIATHSQKLNLLKDHKKGMMQNLFPQEGEKVPKYRFKEFENDGEWCETTLGDIGNFIGGGTPDTTKAEYWNGDIQWYTPTEVKEGKVGKSIRTITELGLKNSSAKLLPKGSLLLTTRATIGDIAIADFECTTNQGFQSLVVKETEINTFWFYWIIRHKNELIKKSSGSTFPEIGKTEITKINALKPNKPEQQKIASCLSSLDALITAQAEKIEQLKQHKKGLMQGLFPKINE